jgi:hypothetical protein
MCCDTHTLTQTHTHTYTHIHTHTHTHTCLIVVVRIPSGRVYLYMTAVWSYVSRCSRNLVVGGWVG